ncbi:putative Protein kinase domain-containing protein [Seiridium cardinale]
MASRAATIQAELQKYFERDPRFIIDSFVGAGQHAATYRVVYSDANTGRAQKFIVKRAFEGAENTDQLLQEKRVLDRLAQNAHIVNLIDFPNNPLQRPLDPTPVDTHDASGGSGASGSSGAGGSSGSARDNNGGGDNGDGNGGGNDGGDNIDSSSDQADAGMWGQVICMEWIENGTLRNFIMKARRQDKPLPNRLLWRFLGCLLRATTGLAWPNQRTVSGSVKLEVIGSPGPAAGDDDDDPIPSLLQHNDLHDGNIMLGPELPDEEHQITPILKWIDFGLAVEMTGGAWDPQYGVKGNLLDVGLIMCGLILRRQWDGRTASVPKAISVRNDLPQLETDAPLFPSARGGPDPCPGNLDNDLRRVVGWIMATNVSRRPQLEDILDNVLNAIRERTEDWSFYKDMPEEKDDYIKALWRRIVLEPDVLPPPPAGAIEVIDLLS